MFKRIVKLLLDLILALVFIYALRLGFSKLLAYYENSLTSIVHYHWLSEAGKTCVPEAGNDVFNGFVRSAILGLQECGIKEYALYGRFLILDDIHQRIAEGAWPIRLKNTSNYIVGFAEEIAPLHNITILWHKAGVMIAVRTM